MGGYLTYTEYKDSEVEWIEKIPSHWNCTKLRFLLLESLANGLFKKKDEWGSGTRIVNVFDVYSEDDLVNEKSLDRVECSELEAERYSAQHGDFFFVRSSLKLEGIGKSATLLNPKEAMVFECHLVRGRPDLASVSPEFLNYYLNSYLARQNLVSRANQVTMTTIDQSKFKNLSVSLPKLNEQRSIARFLDYKTAQIDALIAKKETLLKKLAEKRTALISQAVTKGCDRTVPMKDSGIEWLGEIPAHWNVLQIKRAFVLQRGVDITKEEQSEGEVPVVSSGGIFSYHDTAYAKAPGVIVGRKGTLGKVYYLEQDYWPHDTTLYVIHFYTNYPRFIYYKLLSMQLETWDTGSANPTLNRNLIHPVKTPCPLVEEQVQIVDYLDSVTTSINHQTETINLAIAKLKEYRTALITNAVTGKIDVRDVILETEPMEAA